MAKRFIKKSRIALDGSRLSVIFDIMDYLDTKIIVVSSQFGREVFDLNNIPGEL